MKLSIIITILNQIDLAKTCFKETINNIVTLENEVEIIILDNGSDEPIQNTDFPGAKIFRNEKNIGVYPTFKQGMEVATGDIVSFLHSDVVIWEENWSSNVLLEFKKHTNLGLLGFVGSNEIDYNGGRGYGTASNFQGKVVNNGLKSWSGSSWDKHGKHLLDFMQGTVVDGCVMIIRRDAWNEIGYRDNFPPHHFYDRLISTQMLEKNWGVGILGIEFDHISGSTVNKEKKYQIMSWEWLHQSGFVSPSSYKERFFDNHNYDEDIYKIAEALWLSEYRDAKHIIPIKV